MQINRNYSHKRFGDIGNVTFVAPDGLYMLNGNELSEQSVTHLLTFALQTLQDAYAGAETADEAIAAFEQKRDKLIEGTIGTRGGSGVDEFTRVMRIVMRPVVKQALDDKGRAKFKAMNDDEQNAVLDKNYAANEATFKPVVEAEIARRREEAANRGKLATALSINI